MLKFFVTLPIILEFPKIYIILMDNKIIFRSVPIKIFRLPNCSFVYLILREILRDFTPSFTLAPFLTTLSFLHFETSFNGLHLLAFRELLNSNLEQDVDDIFIPLSSSSSSIPCVCEYRTGKNRKVNLTPFRVNLRSLQAS